MLVFLDKTESPSSQNTSTYYVGPQIGTGPMLELGLTF